MSKISELSDGGSLQSTDYLIAVRSGGNVKVQADGNLSLGALTLTGLTVDGDAVFTTGDAVRLNTSDGADNGVLAITGGGANSDARGARVRLYGNEHASLGGILDIGAGNVSGGHIYSYTNAKLRQKIDYNGDISFYEDTGTTPKFFWDASAESLGIGTVSPTNLLHVSATGLSTPALIESTSTVARIAFKDTATTDANSVRLGSAGNDMSFLAGGAERMRIDSSGNVGIGTTPSGFLTSGYVLRLNGGTQTYLAFNNSTHTTQATGGFVIGNDSGNAYLVQRENLPLRFHTNDTERMLIDASGNLLLAGSGTPASSAGNLVLFNGTAPTGSATNGVILYAEDVSASSELKVRDEAGNVTTLSPHNFDLIPEGPSEDMAWSYYSERDGKRINVDMLKAIRVLEQLSGEKLVHMV